jgi:beta-phosphoglucomutase
MAATADYGVIWDLDGTLVDTSELHFEAWTRLARELNRTVSRSAFERTFGRRNPEIIRELFAADFPDAEVSRLGDRKEEFYRQAARRGMELLPGARSLLEAIHNDRSGQAIGSSAPRANVDLIIDLTGIRHFISVVVSMEDTERGKPDPQVFQIAAERLGVKSHRCIVFEDARPGVEAAKAAGMKCIAVSGAGHYPEASLKESGADRVVKSLEEVSVAVVRRLLRTNHVPEARSGSGGALQ